MDVDITLGPVMSTPDLVKDITVVLRSDLERHERKTDALREHIRHLIDQSDALQKEIRLIQELQESIEAKKESLIEEIAKVLVSDLLSNPSALSWDNTSEGDWEMARVFK